MRKKLLASVLAIATILCIIAVPSHAAETLSATTQTEGGATVNWSYELEGDKVVNLKCTNVSAISGKVAIPATIEDKPVVSIGNSAFKECYGLTEITFPETITSIGSEAFRSCTGLKDVTIPNNVTDLGTRAFRDCSGLKNINLSANLTILKEGVLSYCSGLKTIIIPDKVTSIDYDVFTWCTGLREIIMPDSMASIHAAAFTGVDKSKVTIYGNEGSFAQDYATENNIKFDLISNYGKTDSGSDISAPTVTSIKVTDPKAGTYTTGQKITIQVVFSENVTATTMPTLKIKFGTGAEKSVTNGTLSGNTITYTYTIASDDKGQLLTSSLAGGDVKDAQGNDAELTCPLISGNAIVANAGTTGGTQTPGTNNGGSSNNGGTSKAPSTTNDPTVAKTALPQTGQSFAIIGVIAIITIGGAFYFLKVRKYRDIK